MNRLFPTFVPELAYESGMFCSLFHNPSHPLSLSLSHTHPYCSTSRPAWESDKPSIKLPERSRSPRVRHGHPEKDMSAAIELPSSSDTTTVPASRQMEKVRAIEAARSEKLQEDLGEIARNVRYARDAAIAHGQAIARDDKVI